MSDARPAVEIRPARDGDADTLARVLCRALRAAYLADASGQASETGPRARLAALEPGELLDGARAAIDRTGRDDWTVVAELAGEVVGFERLRIHAAPGRAADGEVASLYVDPRAWGAGAGGRLLEHGMCELRGRGCQRVWLEVAVENGRAQRFYRRHGLAPVGAPGRHPLRAWGVDLGFVLDVQRYARRLHADLPDRPGGTTGST